MKDEARPLVGVHSLIFIKCFDTVVLLAGKSIWPLKPVRKHSVPEQVVEKN